MKPHTKIYLDFFDYKIPEDVSCEICGRPAVDIHHIEARQMGGNPSGDKDRIENLMALCRQDHDEYGDVPGEVREMLKKVHLKYMEYNGQKKNENNITGTIRGDRRFFKGSGRFRF
jgi:5-methylcytosine-specific restriction endonuclease McrA